MRSDDLRPILQDDPTDSEMRLLGSVRLDTPSTTARGRALAALGFAAVTTAAGTGAATTAAAATGTVFLLKWFALGAIGGAMALGAVGGWSPPARQSVGHPVASVVGVTPASRADPVAPSPISEPLPETVPTVERVPDVPATTVPRKAPPPPPPRWVAPEPVSAAPAETPAVSAALLSAPPSAASAPTQPTLGSELLALSKVRGALASGDAATSLRLLDAYERSFERPTLMPEASVLRIEGLVAVGRVDEARDLARRVLVAQPDSPYAQRVRSLVGTP